MAAHEPVAPVSAIARLAVDPDRIALTAATTGRLAVDRSCFRIRAAGGASLAIVWPERTVLADGGSGVLVDGASYRAGDRMTLGGASSSHLPATAQTVGSYRCAAPYFIAATVHRAR